MHTRKKIWENEWAWAFLLGAVFFAGVIATGFRGLYGQDAYEYWRYAKALNESWQGGESPGAFFWPVWYPLAGAVFQMAVRDAALALLLISVLVHQLTWVFVVKIIRRHFGGEGIWPLIFGIAIVFACPYLLRSSALVMADAMAVMLVTLCFFAALEYRSHGQGGMLVLCAAAAVVAVFTRYAAAVPVAVPVLMAAWAWLRRPALLPLLMALATAAMLVAPHFLLNAEKPAGFLGHAWLTNWSTAHFFKSAFHTPDGFNEYALPNLLHAFSVFYHPAFFLPFGLLLFFWRKPDFRQPVVRLALGSILAYAIFLAGIPYQNIRFLNLTLPLVAIAFWPAFSRLVQIKINLNSLKGGIALLLIVNLVLTAYVSRRFIPQWNLEKEMAGAVKSEPARRVISFSLEGAYLYLEVPNEQVNFFKERVVECRSGDWLLLQPEVCEQQWKGMNPGINWNWIQANCQIKLVREFAQGWRLYEIR